MLSTGWWGQSRGGVASGGVEDIGRLRVARDPSRLQSQTVTTIQALAPRSPSAGYSAPRPHRVGKGPRRLPGYLRAGDLPGQHCSESSFWHGGLLGLVPKGALLSFLTPPPENKRVGLSEVGAVPGKGHGEDNRSGNLHSRKGLKGIGAAAREKTSSRAEKLLIQGHTASGNRAEP